ncbi:phage portal protein [Bacillus sp. NTK071]|uniref:phage portal protein n=1 Tax=Bacillus sp. NTK071 TaxID=2802175 RepID=UPI001A8C75DF|nr:phage portal protein [Bacillus sp. NTK071]MBN8211096.1 phage portal protein [Bacillus sp. NTK071]
MANLFTWGKTNDVQSKDLYSTTISVTRPLAIVTEEDALKVPAVKAAVELISNTVAQLPIFLYEEQYDKSVEKIKDERTTLLNNSANLHETAQTLKKKLVQDYLLRGKAYLLLKNGKLFVLEAKNVREELYTDDGFTVSRKEFEYYGTATRTVTFSQEEIIVIDSSTNGLLADSGNLFQTALNQLEYNRSVMDNGAVPSGVLKSASRLTENAITRLRESFSTLYGGSKKAGKTIILEEGLDFEALSMKPEELQLNESSKLMIAEIARVFNLPESMINSSANKYGSLEQNSIQFLQSCIGPIISSIELSFDKYLLTQSEKSLGYFFRFDTSEMIRLTEKEKIETVSKMYGDGLISFNEMRFKIDMKPIENDVYKAGLGDVFKNIESGKYTIPNMGVVENEQLIGGKAQG